MRPTKIQKTLSHLKWFFVYVPLGLFAVVTSPIIALICFPFSSLEKAHPFYWIFWLWLDDEIYDFKTNLDYRSYKKDDFFRWYMWHAFRNTMWNVKQRLKPKNARDNCVWNKELVVEVLQDTLTRAGNKVSIYGNCLEMAGLKWITKDGDEGWHVFSGEKISKAFSTVGTSEIWYVALDSLYYRYSTVRIVHLFGKRYWLYFAMGATDKRYLLNFKMYNYQKMY